MTGIGTPTSLLSNGSSTDATSYTTASVSPSPFALLLLFVSNGHTTAGSTLAPSSITGTFGSTVTWTQIITDTESAGFIRGTWFWAKTDGSPATGTLIINFASTQTQCQWHLVSVLKADLSSPIVQSKSQQFTSTTNPSMTLNSGISTDNATFEARILNSTTAMTPGTGYTLLGSEQGTTSPTIRSSVAYDVTGTTTANWTTTSTANKTLFAIEVADAPTQTALPTAIASGGAMGTPTMTQASGAQIMTPTAVASALTFGTTAITDRVIALPTAIATGQSFGLITIQRIDRLAPTAIASAQGIGTPVASIVTRITPTGIASAGAIGSPTIRNIRMLLPYSIASAEAVSTITLQTIFPMRPTAIASAQGLGNPTLSDRVTSLPSSIASAQAFGALTLTDRVIARPDGIGGTSGVGSPTLGFFVIMSPASIASGEALGSPHMLPGPVSIAPSSIASLEALGIPTINLQPVLIAPAGVFSQEAFSNPEMVQVFTMHPESLASEEALGDPHWTLINNMRPDGVESLLGFGDLAMTMPEPIPHVYVEFGGMSNVFDMVTMKADVDRVVIGDVP